MPSPFSFTSFSPTSSQPADPAKPSPAVPPAPEPAPDPNAPTAVLTASQLPPPLPPQTGAPNPPPAPPAQSKPPRNRWRPVAAGAIVGLAAGLGLGYEHFKQQRAEYESAATVKVSGADAAAEAATLRSPRVLERAARKLDEVKPFSPPLPAAISERVAYLTDHLSASASGDQIALTFHGTNPADTGKYLRAVVEAYRADVAIRAETKATPQPQAPTPSPTPPPVPPSPPSPDDSARVAAERQRLTKELQAITTEDIAAVQARVAAGRAALDTLRSKVQTLDRDLGRILATGPARSDRLATMKTLGITPDMAVTASPSAETRALGTQLQTLQQKKAELGRRLGPAHRDMVALDEQIGFVKAQLEKPDAAPTEPDELDRHRAKLEAERVAAAAEVGVLSAATERDDAVVRAATPLREQLDRLPPAKPAAGPAAAVAGPNAPPANPATPAAPTVATAEVVAPPGEGVRTSPLLYRSLVPGGAIGLVAGAGLGFLVSLAGAAWASRPRRAPKPAALPKTAAPSKSVIQTGMIRIPKYTGPKLGVPVLAQIPAIRTDLPVEKRTTEGWHPSLVCFHRPSGPEAEAFRAARRDLVAAFQNRGHQVIPITTPGGGDGKSTVAANLAISLAQAGKRVILVDCDLRAAKVQELFRLGRLGDSLKNVMSADVDLRAAVRTCELPNLFLLPAGRPPADPVDVLARPKFRELIADLRAAYEYVIIDAPPTTAGPELKPVAEACEGVVLVVRVGDDAPERTNRATSEVAWTGTRVIGAIVNAAPVRPAAPPAPTDATMLPEAASAAAPAKE